ncbi:hypothetical protein EYB53_020690 [Candidatus Chloroploca sp. M-50]|uniref:DUF4350 domain-containing protein n=1 Tax=Candidatus Chloroploca mongolica TaxID=2528176 RepID=A0ABS4DFC2_9CHLR|nr:hypothetical protein [Candidatus Chloroploca mongolica]MBP1468141.1 hypothetical protein [Candidatus Chloroploca mongolica]
MKHWRLLVLFALLVLFVPARLTHAQDETPVRIEVLAGFDGAGHYRIGHWFPTSLVVSNDGPDLQGTLEWRFANHDQALYRYRLDLPQGARKQVRLPVMTTGMTRAATVAFSVDGEALTSTRVSLVPLNESQITVGVLSRDRSMLNSLAAATFAPNTTTIVSHLDPTLLPDDPALLSGINIIFVHDFVTADLSPRQREALDLWIHLGGVLVVSGGAAASQSVPGLDDLLPVNVGELQAGVSAASLAALVQQATSVGELPNFSANRVTFRPGAQPLDRAGLLVSHHLGVGQVIFAAFDLASTRMWSGEAELWQAVITLQPQMPIAASFRWRNESLLANTLQLPGLQFPSTGILLLLMGFYIVIIGPLNFLVLRKLGRIDLAWFTTPGLIVLFLIASYGISLLIRGTAPTVPQLALVQSFEGHQQGKATVFLGVFSPQRQSYQLQVDAQALITPATFERFQANNVPVTRDDASAGMEDLLIDVSSLRTLMVEQMVDEVPDVVSKLQMERRRIYGELTVTDTDLRDAMIVHGESAQSLGDLRAGTQVAVDLMLDQGNFPFGFWQENSTMINRGQVLNNLFGSGNFMPFNAPVQNTSPGIVDDGIYLLGWQEASLLEVTLPGHTPQHQGETLYMIRLEHP